MKLADMFVSICSSFSFLIVISAVATINSELNVRQINDLILLETLSQSRSSADKNETLTIRHIFPEIDANFLMSMLEDSNFLD